MEWLVAAVVVLAAVVAIVYVVSWTIDTVRGLTQREALALTAATSDGKASAQVAAMTLYEWDALGMPPIDRRLDAARGYLRAPLILAKSALKRAPGDADSPVALVIGSAGPKWLQAIISTVRQPGRQLSVEMLNLGNETLATVHINDRREDSVSLSRRFANGASREAQVAATASALRDLLAAVRLEMDRWDGRPNTGLDSATLVALTEGWEALRAYVNAGSQHALAEAESKLSIIAPVLNRASLFNLLGFIKIERNDEQAAQEYFEDAAQRANSEPETNVSSAEALLNKAITQLRGYSADKALDALDTLDRANSELANARVATPQAVRQKVLAYRAHVEGHLVRFFQESNDPAIGKRWGDRVATLDATAMNASSDRWAQLAYQEAKTHAAEVLAAQQLDSDAKLMALNAQGYAAMRYAEWSTVPTSTRLDLLNEANRLLTEAAKEDPNDYTVLDNLALVQLAFALTDPVHHLDEAYALASRSRQVRPNDFFAPWLLANVSLQRSLGAHGQKRDWLLDNSLRELDAAITLRPDSKFLKVSKSKALLLDSVWRTSPPADHHGQAIETILRQAALPSAAMTTRNDYESAWCLVVVEVLRALQPGAPNTLANARADGHTLAQRAKSGPLLRAVQDIASAAEQLSVTPDIAKFLTSSPVTSTLVQ